MGSLQTLTLPSPVTLRSAGSVAEVYDLETGEKSNPLKTKDMTTENWEYAISRGFFYLNVTDMASASAQLLSEKYLFVGAKTDVEMASVADKSMASGPSGAYIKIKDNTFNDSTLSQFIAQVGDITYELATPNDPTQLTPVIDNTILTEGGGTINTIQTQTPVIDNCLDVGYLAL